MDSSLRHADEDRHHKEYDKLIGGESETEECYQRRYLIAKIILRRNFQKLIYTLMGNSCIVLQRNVQAPGHFTQIPDQLLFIFPTDKKDPGSIREFEIGIVFNIGY